MFVGGQSAPTSLASWTLQSAFVGNSTLPLLYIHRTLGSVCFCVLRSRKNAESFNLNASSRLDRAANPQSDARKRQRADSTRENKEKVKFARCVPGLRADRVREFVDYGRTWLIADWAAPNGGCARENMWKTRNKIPPRDASFARKINLKIHRLSIPSKAKPLKRENVIPHFPLVFPPRTTSWRLLIPARCGISHVPAYSINFPTRFSSKTKPRATPISFYVLSSFFHRGMCVIWLRNLKRSWILAIVFANSTVFRV